MNKLKVLISFICSIATDYRTSKAGTGICIYDTDAILQHLDKVNRLCTACGWRLSEFKPKQLGDTHSFWIGPKNESPTEDELLKQFNCQ